MCAHPACASVCVCYVPLTKQNKKMLLREKTDCEKVKQEKKSIQLSHKDSPSSLLRPSLSLAALHNSWILMKNGWAESMTPQLKTQWEFQPTRPAVTLSGLWCSDCLPVTQSRNTMGWKLENVTFLNLFLLSLQKYNYNPLINIHRILSLVETGTEKTDLKLILLHHTFWSQNQKETSSFRELIQVN